MKWKLVSAFAIGVVLASVMVYFAIRPLANLEEPQHVASVHPVGPVQSAPTVQKAAPIAPPQRQPEPVAKHDRPVARVPVREKPSPFRAPIAKYVPPPAPSAAPVPSVPVQPVSMPPPKPELKPEPKAGPSVTLAAGTLIPVRIGQALSSARNLIGDTFSATLARPLVVDGWVIAESGAAAEGRVEDKAVPNLKIAILRVATSDGQNVRIHAEPYVKVPLVDVPVGAQITFRVLDPVTITERLN